MRATFVIVGGGIAGVSCAEQLTFLCPEEPILLISATSMVKTVTNLSQISQILSTFEVEEKDNQVLEGEHSNLCVKQGIVKEIDPDKHEIYMACGEVVHYHYVVLCHGARPKLLSNDKYIFGIRDTESVAKFQEVLQGARKIVIVGNGGIATEMVHELKNVEIVWVIKDSSITSTFVDPGAGQFFLDELFKKEVSESEPVVKRSKYTAQEFKEKSDAILGGALGPDWHSNIKVQGRLPQEKSVTIENECEVSSVQKASDNKDFKVSVTLTNGKVIDCDFVVSATGVVPNGDMIKIRGLALDENKAIIVNNQMETNIKDIFSAGDVCSCSNWNHSPLWFQMRLWTQARQLGHFAGQCMFSAWQDTAETKELDFCFEIFTHATKFFGHKVILLGLFNAQGLDVQEYEVLLRVTKGREYVKVILKDGKMQGAILIGETDLEETFENLILNQMDLSTYGEHLLDPDIDIEDYFD